MLSSLLEAASPDEEVITLFDGGSANYCWMKLTSFLLEAMFVEQGERYEPLCRRLCMLFRRRKTPLSSLKNVRTSRNMLLFLMEIVPIRFMPST